jgi:hypothetical protein
MCRLARIGVPGRALTLGVVGGSLEDRDVGSGESPPPLLRRRRCFLCWLGKRRTLIGVGGTGAEDVRDLKLSIRSDNVVRFQFT